ncbi:hypothetical protein [Pseudacidovorax intermedius]|uniref:hypothetical protein n=1 Tax=Pseudacidovorax intermedius TaxID=433924 RepID=UPI0012DE8E31|nr:hypothetical protein [Pseudacidovorax intermedius]
MPNKINSAQIDLYQSMVDQGRHQNFYHAMSNNGYRYTYWALGVAKGGTITGSAALDYLKGTALLGLGGDACRNLSAERIDAIRVSMAQGYLNTCIAESQAY